MTFRELMKANRSYRRFDESVRITRDQLEELVSVTRMCPSSNNKQAIKFFLSCDDETNAKITALTGWLRLSKIKLPIEGRKPCAFIVVCHDDEVRTASGETLGKNAGICAMAIMLAATEMGFGGCMHGLFSPERIREALGLRDTLHPLLILSLGKPNEEVEMVDAVDGDTLYYQREEDDVHIVPKRPLKELLLN